MPIQGLRITDLVASTEVGFLCDSVVGLGLQNAQVNAERGPAFDLRSCKNVELHRIKTTAPRADDPVVRMEDVEDAFIQGCRTLPGTGTFLELTGEATKGIILAANGLSAARNPFVLKKGARKGAVIER